MTKCIVMLIAMVVSMIISGAGFVVMEKIKDFEVAGGFFAVLGAMGSFICGIVALVLYVCP